jgi:hypothetical protein
MALVEQVNQMRQQGMSEDQITKTLLEQKFSAVQIQEALSQANIKQEVTGQPNQAQQAQVPVPGQEMQQGMQPSVSQGYVQPSAIENQAQNQQMQQAYPQNQQMQQQYADQYAQQDQQAYYPQDQRGYYQQQVLDAETVREMSKQIIEESLDKTKKEIQELTKLKTDLKFEIQNIDNRLKKIESTIEQLQSAILQKVGNYGEAISDISQELKATQDSFAKLVNPLVDSKRQTQTTAKKTKKGKSRKKRRRF